MSKPEEYKAIRLWCKHMGSYDYFIIEQQRAASVDGAPIDAIYKTSDADGGKWRTIRDLTDHPVRQQYESQL